MPPQFTLIELVVDDAEPDNDTVLLVVTKHIHVRVSVDVDPDLVARVVDAICQC
ncbi:MAG: hypothetical protein AB8H79_20975 [Myxococcota bacterium]